MKLITRLLFFCIMAAMLGGVWLVLQRGLSSEPKLRQQEWADFFEESILPCLPVVDGFDYPLHSPKDDDAWLKYGFMQSKNLGEAWGYGKKDECLGEPVYAVADGWVLLAIDFQSYWGGVVITCHRMPPGNEPPSIECLYARLGKIDVKPGQIVRRGDQIGEVGNTGIKGTAHLYFELRDRPGLQLGPVDWQGEEGWLNPSAFIHAHRPREATPQPPSQP